MKHISLNIVGVTATYAVKHNDAVRRQNGLEAPIVGMFNALQAHASAHHALYGSHIGEDGVLGEHWADMLRGLRGLLNGECGRLDCGTVDAAILQLAAEHGVDLES